MTIRSIPALRENYGSKRVPKEICIHHKAAYATNETTGKQWQQPKYYVSSNYGIFEDDVCQFVPDDYTSYCQGNSAANERALSIEVSNSELVKAPTYAQSLKAGDDLGWPVSDKSLDTLIKLCAELAKKWNLVPLVVGKTLTYHSMYKATQCPGPYLLSRMQYIADEANKLIAGPPPASKKLYGVVRQVIALSDKTKADQYAKELNSQGEKDAYYKVIEI